MKLDKILFKCEPLPNFISHTVQMKLIFCSVYFSSSKSLYIPHGSDETYSYLIPDSILYCLYIPHGSDETSYNETYIDEEEEALYIPHGSDETFGTDDVPFFDDPELYIPHGSDETPYRWSRCHLALFFISHTVQMKPTTVTDVVPF